VSALQCSIDGSNMMYALVLPGDEIFVAAYVMRNSHAVAKVVTYQLSIYAATPLAFYLNGKMLGRVGAKHLYAAGMLLSGAAMMLMMNLSSSLQLALGLLASSWGWPPVSSGPTADSWR